MSILRSVYYDHKWKKWGIGIACLGAGAMIAERLHGFMIFARLDANAHFYLFQWILLLGLFIVIFCKEKYEDDRAKALRARAFQLTFVVQQAMLLGIALTGSMRSNMMQIPASSLFLWSAVGMFVYLFIFYTGLYFDFLVPYDKERADDNKVSARRIGWGMLAFLILLAIIVFAGLFFGGI